MFVEPFPSIWTLRTLHAHLTTPDAVAAMDAKYDAMAFHVRYVKNAFEEHKWLMPVVRHGITQPNAVQLSPQARRDLSKLHRLPKPQARSRKATSFFDKMPYSLEQLGVIIANCRREPCALPNWITADQPGHTLEKLADLHLIRSTWTAVQQCDGIHVRLSLTDEAKAASDSFLAEIHGTLRAVEMFHAPEPAHVQASRPAPSLSTGASFGLSRSVPSLG